MSHGWVKRIVPTMVSAASAVGWCRHSRQRLTQLSDRMNKQDVEKVSKILQGTPPPSQDNSDDDPFK